ncbi:MAG: hypothetical protein AAF862_15155, partial [Pseudomonadota bacterium]
MKLLPLFVLLLVLLPLTQVKSGNPDAVHCDNNYSQAAKLVDAALSNYGTLYSGGLHHHSLDDIRGTIELYRFWTGLPDSKLRDFGSWVQREYDFQEDYPRNYRYRRAGDLWRDAQWLLKDAKSKDEPEGFWAAWGLDALTSVGPGVDWWHRPNDFQNLTQWQKWVAQTSATEQELDWLQTVLAASNAPWANHAHLSANMSEDLKVAYRRLSQTAWQKYVSDDALIWLVAAAITSPDPYQTTPIDAQLSKLGDRIADCTASPEDYAAYAVSISVRARMRGPGYNWRPGPLPDDIVHQGLPATVQRAIAVDYLYGATFRRWPTYWQYASLPQDAIRQFRAVAPDDYAWQSMLDFAALYSAQTIDEIPVSRSAYVRRAYNALSSDDLLSLGRRAKDDSLMIAAFARYIALGEWRKATSLLPEVKSALPDQAADIDGFFGMDESLPVRLSLIALHIPYMSTIVGGGNWYPDAGLWLWHHNLGIRYDPVTPEFFRKSNLPRAYATQRFLLRDLEVW